MSFKAGPRNYAVIRELEVAFGGIATNIQEDPPAGQVLAIRVAVSCSREHYPCGLVYAA